MIRTIPPAIVIGAAALVYGFVLVMVIHYLWHLKKRHK